MPRRVDSVVAVALALATVVPGCVRSIPPERVEAGRHRVLLRPPPGWEHLDHGREQVFRSGEMSIVLEDLGPASRDGLARELREARDVWLQGRRKDAYARVQALHGPALLLARSETRAAFWGPWTDLSALHDAADSASIGRAFDALIEGTRSLPDVSPEAMAGYAVSVSSSGSPRGETARQGARVIHHANWFEVETWDRVTHLMRSRLAVVDDGGFILSLRIDRGSIERTGPVFESLLSSIRIEPPADQRPAPE